ncbi:hypothetical protein [Cellulomonas fimi]|uniref:hypothetical protein n=1 Tax=Cellulomonas fimi TaxID=1708 RepID=UPI001E39C61B
MHAARQMGVSPAACVVVEDSRYGGAGGARGRDAFARVRGGLTPAEWLEGPGTTVFDDMRALPPLLASV